MEGSLAAAQAAELAPESTGLGEGSRSPRLAPGARVVLQGLKDDESRAGSCAEGGAGGAEGGLGRLQECLLWRV